MEGSPKTTPSHPTGIARPRDIHRMSLLGPSVHVPYYTSPFNIFFQSTAAVLIEDLSGRPMDIQRLQKLEHQISHM